MKNPVKKLIELAGNQTILAKMLHVKQQQISKWVKKGAIPLRRLPGAIKLCRGKMSPTELCPNDRHLIEIIQQTQKGNTKTLRKP